jgi:hypothetical protein
MPAKTAENLLVGLWNVQDFDRMSAVWRSATGDSPIRDLSQRAVHRGDRAPLRRDRSPGGPAERPSVPGHGADRGDRLGLPESQT